MRVRILLGTIVGISAALALMLTGGIAAQSGGAREPAASKDWPTYGHDPGGMRFSPLTELTPANVSGLEVAWVYHMKPPAPAPSATAPAPPTPPPGGRGRGRGGAGFASSEATPLVINGLMYTSTPYYRVVAIDAATGKEAWAFQLPSGNPSTRGVEYWPGDARTPPQIVFGTSDAKLYSLNAKTGVPNEAFGEKGVISLDTPEILQGLPGRNGLSSPPIVYKNLVITGGTTQENPPRGPAGDVRAWDLHTGKLAWTFHSVPRAGEKFNDSWAADSWKNRSGVNVWGFITVDAARGLVYMPFGAPSVDQYGGDREGNNLFGTSLVAADANTGKYLWHFQIVHHDIWDADLAAAPLLLDVGKVAARFPRWRSSARSGCCSSSIASPASRSTASRNAPCRRPKCRRSAPRKRNRSRSSRRRSRACPCHRTTSRR